MGDKYVYKTGKGSYVITDSPGGGGDFDVGGCLALCVIAFCIVVVLKVTCYEWALETISSLKSNVLWVLALPPFPKCILGILIFLFVLLGFLENIEKKAVVGTIIYFLCLIAFPILLAFSSSDRKNEELEQKTSIAQKQNLEERKIKTNLRRWLQKYKLFRDLKDYEIIGDAKNYKLALVTSYGAYAFHSSDRGRTWQPDHIRLDSSYGYLIVAKIAELKKAEENK